MKQLPKLADIHTHILYSLDDGADSKEEMLHMLDTAYTNGTRILCATPHFSHPNLPRYNVSDCKSVFAEFESTAKEKYPDMEIYLGNEIFYHHDISLSLDSGKCTPLGNEYLLIEFYPNEELCNILGAVNRIFSAGYIPIIAHIERYTALFGRDNKVRELSERGAKIQINALSITRWQTFPIRSFVYKLIGDGLVDVVASDAHNSQTKAPNLIDAYRKIEKKFDSDVADLLFVYNPSKIARGRNF